MALDRADGKLKWNTQLKVAAAPSEPGDEDRGPSPGGGSAGGAAPTPVTDGQFVYAFFGNGVLGCVDATGKQVWARRLLVGGHRNMYGLAASPVKYGDLLIQVVDRGANARRPCVVRGCRSGQRRHGGLAERSPGEFVLDNAGGGSRSRRRRAGYDRSVAGDRVPAAHRAGALARGGFIQRGTHGVAGGVWRRRCAGRQRRADRAPVGRQGRRDEVSRYCGHPTSRRRRWPARLAAAMDGATSLATAS